MSVVGLPTRLLMMVVAVLLPLAGLVAPGPGSAAQNAPRAAGAAGATVPKGLHVVGNQLLDNANQPVVLRGVNRSGAEYQCFNGNGIFDGRTDDSDSIAAIASWHVNAVRVPLNEDCWLGVNGVAPAYSGSNYKKAIKSYVKDLHAAGLVAILDLHRSDSGTEPADDNLKPMPDASRAPMFWNQVATAFKNDTSTVFDLFNEPFGVTWDCWQSGDDCGVDYPVAGMQSLVTTVRSTGAKNPILLAGLEFGNDLREWVAHKPYDSADGLMASWHSYSNNRCRTVDCWDAEVRPVAGSVPVVADEIGEYDCAHTYLDDLLPWLDVHGVGYLGWAWNTADCGRGPSLISDYDGTPTPYGVGLRDHLAALADGPLRATATVKGDSAPYYYEEDLALTPSARVTTLSVTITVRRTSAGVTYENDYNTAATGVVRDSHQTTTTAVSYKYVLTPGESFDPGGTVTLAAGFDNHDGSARSASGDTYKVVATVGGHKVTRTGHF